MSSPVFLFLIQSLRIIELGVCLFAFYDVFLSLLLCLHLPLILFPAPFSLYSLVFLPLVLVFVLFMCFVFTLVFLV